MSALHLSSSLSFLSPFFFFLPVAVCSVTAATPGARAAYSAPVATGGPPSSSHAASLRSTLLPCSTPRRAGQRSSMAAPRHRRPSPAPHVVGELVPPGDAEEARGLRPRDLDPPRQASSSAVSTAATARPHPAVSDVRSSTILASPRRPFIASHHHDSVDGPHGFVEAGIAIEAVADELE
uniref:Uncharacterized protein n=1 Tax=Oryza meridionalis TaxID=40149 RepID=A0A0E0F3L6_9ORYZ